MIFTTAFTAFSYKFVCYKTAFSYELRNYEIMCWFAGMEKFAISDIK